MNLLKFNIQYKYIVYCQLALGIIRNSIIKSNLYNDIMPEYYMSEETELELTILLRSKYSLDLSWGELSKAQKKLLLSMSIEEDNREIMDILYEKEPDLFTNSETLIKALKQNNVGLFNYLLPKDKNHAHRGDITDEQFFQYGVHHHNYKIIPKLDYTKVRDQTQLDFLARQLKTRLIDMNNQLVPFDEESQKGIDFINKNGINIYNNLADIIYLLAQSHDPMSDTALPTVVDFYLNNEEILNKIQEKSHSNKNLSAIDFRQHILDICFNKIIINNIREIETVKYLIEQGASIHVEENLKKKLLFRKEVDFLQTLESKGMKMAPYKEQALHHHMKYVDVNPIKYWVKFFKNKNEALVIIKNYPAPENTIINISNNKNLEEISNYINKLILEEKLQATLEIKSEINQPKI